MKDYRFYLNENTEGIDIEMIKGLIQSLGYSKFNNKAGRGEKGYTYEETSKTYKITIYDTDRGNVRDKVEHILKSNRIRTSYKKYSSSSFEGLNFALGGKGVNILFKPVAGQGGSGAGALQTELQETTQALFLSLSFNVLKRKINKDDLSKTNLENAYNFVDSINPPISELMILVDDKNWLNTFIETTNELYTRYFESSKIYKFERGSKFVNSLYKEYRENAKSMGIRAKDDKWNPADIWMISNNVNIPNNINGLIELNKVIKTNFLKQDLIGISLKKIDKKPKISIYNLSTDNSDLWNFNRYEFSDKSKDMYLYGKGGSGRIQFRTFNNLTGFQGEIIGKTAKHGKIGYEMIRYFLSKYGNPKIPNSQSEVADLFKKDDIIILSEFIDLWFKYTRIRLRNIEEAIEYFSNLSNNYKDFMFSNYLAMKMIETIEEMTPEGRDSFVNSCFMYAKSSSDFSSVFVKVE